MGERPVEAITTALAGQPVTVPETAAAYTVLPRLDDSLKTILQQPNQVAEEEKGVLDRTLFPES